ncbi:MAG: Hsp20/alpha crystallin family protein [bacterium]|nr:Hsp20/alpha crystallin family protein [bacterium]
MVNITKEKNDTTAVDENLKDETVLDSTQTGEWLDDDDFSGQLAVDVYQTKDEIIIKSTIAGVRTEDIDIAINNDMITIRGKREKEESITEDDYFYRECYWGGFSRSIILPCDVKSDKVKANMKNGVLTIALPKADKVNKVTVVKVKEE